MHEAVFFDNILHGGLLFVGCLALRPGKFKGLAEPLENTGTRHGSSQAGDWRNGQSDQP
jgi:hypothetical protein